MKSSFTNVLEECKCSTSTTFSILQTMIMLSKIHQTFNMSLTIKHLLYNATNDDAIKHATSSGAICYNDLAFLQQEMTKYLQNA